MQEKTHSSFLLKGADPQIKRRGKEGRRRKRRMKKRKMKKKERVAKRRKRK